jgi:hypothetical protein
MSKIEGKVAVPTEMENMQAELINMFNEDASLRSDLSNRRSVSGSTSENTLDATPASQETPVNGESIGSVEDLIQILGGTPPSANTSSFKNLGYVCGEGSSTPSECIDLSIKPSAGRKNIGN